MASSGGIFALKPNSKKEIMCTHVNYTIQKKLTNDKTETLATGLLYLPLPQDPNPHIEKINAKMLKWLVKKRLLQKDSAEYKAIEATKVPALFSTPLNKRGPGSLFFLCKFTSWLFIFDEIMDKNFSKTGLIIEQLQTTFGIFKNILKNTYKTKADIPTSAFPKHKAFCAALFSIRKSFNIRIEKGTCRSANVDFFLEELNSYFNSMIDETKTRIDMLAKEYEDYDFIDEEIYKKLRLKTGAIKLCYVYLACILDIDLKIIIEEIKRDIIKNQIDEDETYSLALYNDLFSSFKEEEEEGHINFISLYLFRHPGASKQEAIKYLEEVYNKIMIRLLVHADKIEQTTEKTNAFLSYLLLQHGCNYDNGRWTEDSDRYKKKDLIVKCSYTTGPLPKKTNAKSLDAQNYKPQTLHRRIS